MADTSPWQQLSGELDSIVDHFTNLLKASRIPDEEAGELGAQRDRKVPGDLLEVWAEKLLFSAFMCLHHISELKKTAAVSDFVTQIQNGRSAKDELRKADDTITYRLAGVKAEAQALLAQLEQSYYSSQHKGRATDSGVSEQLRELCHLALEAPLVAAAANQTAGRPS